MFLEHILYSSAVAILVGIVAKRYYGYDLPVWIIAACAWAPDIDYICQTAMNPTFNACWFFVQHGSFHSFFATIAFSLVIAWLFNKYMNMDFKEVFICAAIGYITHIICDVTVYSTDYLPFYPFQIRVFSQAIIPETHSWFGLAEPSLMIIGIVFLIFAILLKFHLSSSMWITNPDTKTQKEEI